MQDVNTGLESMPTITATEGVQGGGSLENDVDVTLDIDGLDAVSVVASDYIVIYDVSAGVHKKVLASELGAPSPSPGEWHFDDSANSAHAALIWD